MSAALGASRDRISLLALPATLYMAAAFAIPLFLLLITSVTTPQGLSLATYREFFADAYSWKVLGNTLESALKVTLVALIIGYPMAFALARSSGITQVILLIALILPLSVGVVVKAFSWSILLRSNGVLNTALVNLGIVEQPIRLIFTEVGLLIGAVNVFLPFMVLPIYSVVKMIDRRYVEAASTLGASPWHSFRKVTVPLTMPGVIAGVSFVFSMAVSMYVIPTLLIGERYQTLSTIIARSFLFMRDRPRGATVAVVLLLIALAVVFLSAWLARRHRRNA
jgi:putative spermidine/putrescine transport system permease protein